jgi:hypothetical protein
LGCAERTRFRLSCDNPFQIHCMAYSLNKLCHEQRNLRQLWTIKIVNGHCRVGTYHWDIQRFPLAIFPDAKL